MQASTAITRAAGCLLLGLPCSMRQWSGLRMMSVLAEHYPVAICGGGPTGQTLAALLGKYGVPSVLFERSTTPPQHPQAHYIINRSMEVFRGLGGLAEAVKRQSPPLELWRKFVYCESLTGHILGSVDHFEGQETAHAADVSPEPVAHLSQNRLATLLADMLRRSDLTTVSHGCTVDYIRHLPHGGVAVHATNASGQEHSTTCDYLVLADGANSRLRDGLGVAMEGQRAMQSLINIHFSSPALASRLLDRPAMLYFVFNAGVIAVVVAHDLTQGIFVAQVPFFPPLQSSDSFTTEVCRQLLAEAIGTADSNVAELLADLKIHSVRPWTMHAEVAQHMKQDNVFLAGDAAHRFPPAGGFGMNTGIQDAHNLAWKLAAVLHGKAQQGLLDSYEAERRPVAAANTALSVANFQESLAVPRALGLDPRAATALQAALTSPLTAALPPGVSAALFEGGLRLGRRLGTPSAGPLQGWRRARLAQLLDGGATLRLQYPKEDLGFVYTASGAVCPEPSQPATSSAPAAAGGRGAPYAPTTAPGARLPHALLGDSLSTLDLVDRCCGGRPLLLLLLGKSPDAQPWLAAAQALESLPLRVCQVVPAAAGQHGLRSMDSPTDPVAINDAFGHWQRVREVTEAGAILVRPDGHVAWRSHSGGDVQHCTEQLRTAVRQTVSL